MGGRGGVGHLPCFDCNLRPLNEPISARVVPLEQITFVLAYIPSRPGLDDYMAALGNESPSCSSFFSWRAKRKKNNMNIRVP